MAQDLTTIIEKLIPDFKIKVEDDEYEVNNWTLLDENDERAVIFKRDIDDVYGPLIICTNEDDEEFLVELLGDECLQTVNLECKITLDEVSPFDFIQYKYEDNIWRLAKITNDSCRHYIQRKFEVWKHMLDPKEITCKPQLQRMIRTGVVTTLFDKNAFPEPEEMKEKYIVFDHHGKKINIPHPVSGLRLWNSENQTFEDVDPTLEGVPETAEAVEEMWQGMLSELRKYYPDEMVEIEQKLQKEQEELAEN